MRLGVDLCRHRFKRWQRPTGGWPWEWSPIQIVVGDVWKGAPKSQSSDLKHGTQPYNGGVFVIRAWSNQDVGEVD